MAIWWRALFPLLFVTLSCVYQGCASPTGPQRVTYSYSLRFTRCIRTRVQQLLRRYKEQQLGDQQFEDRNMELKTLPSLSTNFKSWLQVKDWERLSAASRDLHTYWAHLDRKRIQLERERRGQTVGQTMRRSGRPTRLPESIQTIQMDLRDLMRQVDSQLKSVNRSSINATSSPALTHSVSSLPPSQTQTLWTSRVEGYVILRDLERYLTKLARDFLLLVAKRRDTPHSLQIG